MKLFITLLCGLAFTAPFTYAQERSSTPGVDLQSTWNTLNSKVNDSSAKADMVDARINQIVVCNKKAMLYAPGAGADAQGCIENSKIVALGARIDAANTMITSINTQITSINGQLSTMTSKINNIQVTLTTMNTQVAGLNSNAADLDVKATTAINSINDLYSRLNTLNGQLSSMSGTINTHTAQIADLYNRIASANASIASITNSINSQNASASSLNNTISGLNSYMSNILYCGANNLIWNPNAGCVAPTGTSTCSLYISRTGSYSTSTWSSGATSPSFTCPGGTFQSDVATGSRNGYCGGGGSENGTGVQCTITTIARRCFAMSCS